MCTGSDRIWHTVSFRASTFLEHLHSVHHLGWCTHSLVLQNDGRDLAEALQFVLNFLGVPFGKAFLKVFIVIQVLEAPVS